MRNLQENRKNELADDTIVKLKRVQSSLVRQDARVSNEIFFWGHSKRDFDDLKGLEEDQNYKDLKEIAVTEIQNLNEELENIQDVLKKVRELIQKTNRTKSEFGINSDMKFLTAGRKNENTIETNVDALSEIRSAMFELDGYLELQNELDL